MGMYYLLGTQQRTDKFVQYPESSSISSRLAISKLRSFPIKRFLHREITFVD